MTKPPAHCAESSEVERSRDLLGLLVDGVQDYAIIMLDVDGKIATWNSGAQRFKGYRAEEIIGRHFSVFYPEEDIAAGKPAQELAIAAAEGRLEDEGWRVRQDGSQFWANVVITALRDSEGALRGFGKITRDLTERRAAELVLRASEDRFRLMVEGVKDYAILMLDVDGRVATWNLGAERFKGYRAEEIIGQHFSVFYPPEDIAAGKPARELQIADSEGQLEDEGWRVRRDGTRFWANVIITALRDQAGVLRGYSKIARDLTERRGHEVLLEHMADHDPLTDLSNRRSFDRELNAHVARIARYGVVGAVLVLDIDYFKYFNDAHGRSGGDRFIKRVATGLRARLRESDVLARLGADEFAVLLPQADEHTSQVTAEALLQVVRDEAMPALLGSRKQVTASVGIALFKDAEQLSADEILVNADLAMYDAKEAGRDRWSRYRTEENSRPKSESRMRWAKRINDAVANDRLELLAQPIVPLLAGAATQYELLLRMREVNGGLILPGSFLNVAERLGLIGEIDRWVTHRAIDMLAEQRSLGRDLRFEVNISGHTIGDEALLELVARRLQETGVPADRLIFEITETAAIADIGRAIGFAKRLSQLGCGFALDDFGVGYGSFFYLKHLPFDYLKIDGEFVRNCDKNETDRVLISAAVNIARRMGIQTIAEFVGSDEVVDVLRKLGVDYGQGFHLGRPAPLADHLAASNAHRLPATGSSFARHSALRC